MSNYQIIKDETALREFIEWLPELEPGEVYYVSLIARSKYTRDLPPEMQIPHVRSDKAQLKRFTSTKETLFDKIRQLECPIGCYKHRETLIPQESLAVYITPNPRSLEKAMHASLVKFSQLLTKEYGGWNPHQEVMSEIQKARSRRVFSDFDFDIDDPTQIIDAIRNNNLINLDACHFLMTRGGFHLLVELSKLKDEFKSSWFNNISKIAKVDVSGDNMIPIPGCIQGGVVPKLLKS